MNSVDRCVGRIAHFDSSLHFLGRAADAASATLGIASNGLPTEGSSAQKKIEHATRVISHTALSINVIRLFCALFKLPYRAYHAWKEGHIVGVLGAFLDTIFAAFRALSVTNEIRTLRGKLACPRAAYASQGLLAVGLVGGLFLSCRDYRTSGNSQTKKTCIADIVCYVMDLISWTADTVRMGLKHSATAVWVSLTCALATAVTSVVKITLFDEWHASPSVIAL